MTQPLNPVLFRVKLCVLGFLRRRDLGIHLQHVTAYRLCRLVASRLMHAIDSPSGWRSRHLCRTTGRIDTQCLRRAMDVQRQVAAGLD